MEVPDLRLGGGKEAGDELDVGVHGAAGVHQEHYLGGVGNALDENEVYLAAVPRGLVNRFFQRELVFGPLG